MKKLDNISNNELLELFERSGLSERKFAAQQNFPFDRFHGRLFRAKKTRSQGDNIEITEEENHCEIDCKSPRIKTLDQLIAECKIDLEVWQIERHVINKWEVGAKDDSKRIVVEPLFQVKAWMVRRHPEYIVQPVSINYKFEPRNAAPVGNLTKSMIIADPHFGFSRDMRTGKLTPFHDRRCLDLALQLLSDGSYTNLFILGDTLDLAEWSDKFLVSPEFYWTTQPALMEAAWWLGQFRERVQKVVKIEGNHDLRLQTKMKIHLAAAYNIHRIDDENALPVMSIPNLLAFDTLGIEYSEGYPDSEYWVDDSLKLAHGDLARQQPGATARGMIEKNTETVIFGHVHRQELVTKKVTVYNGIKITQSFCPGCVCKIDGTVPGSKRDCNWQNGIGIVYHGNVSPAIVPILITDGLAIVDGKMYRGEEKDPTF